MEEGGDPDEREGGSRKGEKVGRVEWEWKEIERVCDCTGMKTLSL